ncbi:uncharacterized protein NPIL_541851 [Nephila pilipes]|uniref:Uncharacterized protein n=1 Tax=Nephila pilipes TaxID=299642 RepID=A0A8X6TWS4_NEPPI|nr:uncharacterized protein NPIL_625841 [Nephila pilipes]GFT64894.1 uncharacterized protein NPIL_541851 [Nephila pilipes]
MEVKSHIGLLYYSVLDKDYTGRPFRTPKVEHVRISKEALKLLNVSERRNIFEIRNDDEAYIPVFDFPTHQESKAWGFEGDPKPTIVKRQRPLKKVMYTTFFRCKGLLKSLKRKGQKSVTAKRFNLQCLPE